MTWLFGCDGQVEIKAAAQANLCGKANLTVVFFYNGFRDGQSESGATVLALIGGIRLGKFFEDLILELRRDTRALVCHANAEACIAPFDDNLDFRLQRGKLGRIGK